MYLPVLFHHFCYQYYFFNAKSLNEPIKSLSQISTLSSHLEPSKHHQKGQFT